MEPKESNETLRAYGERQKWSEEKIVDAYKADVILLPANFRRQEEPKFFDETTAFRKTMMARLITSYHVI